MSDIMLFLHVLSAIVAVGASLTFVFWTVRAVREPQARSAILTTIGVIERAVVMPAYAVLLVTGVILWLDRYEVATPWIELALVLYIVLAGIVGFHIRAIKRQLALDAAGDSDSDEYARIDRRGRILRILHIVAAIAILYLMQFKPALWG